MYTIIVTNQRGKQSSFRFTNGSATVGKDAKCDIVMQGWTVAAVHARLEQKNGEVYISDLGGSRAGVEVNDEAISEYGPVKPNDEIKIGQNRLVVRRDASKAEMTQPTLVPPRSLM